MSTLFQPLSTPRRYQISLCISMHDAYLSPRFGLLIIIKPNSYTYQSRQWMREGEGLLIFMRRTCNLLVGLQQFLPLQ